MIKRIFTGNYDTCKAGNLISISGDRGKSAVSSHFYAHIGAGPKVFHPPMSKLM